MPDFSGFLSTTAAGVAATFNWVTGLSVIIACGIVWVRRLEFGFPRVLNAMISVCAGLMIWRAYTVLNTPLVQLAAFIVSSSMALTSVAVLCWVIARTIQQLGQAEFSKQREQIVTDERSRAGDEALTRMVMSLQPMPHGPPATESAPQPRPPTSA